MRHCRDCGDPIPDWPPEQKYCRECGMQMVRDADDELMHLNEMERDDAEEE